MAKVTIIKPTIDVKTKAPIDKKVKRKVAAYARVSTDSDEQATSYEAQVDFYTKKINENKDWEFVNVYTDEGISGTNTKKREGFKQMVNDAMDGKIDLIITKSVSRFARNTVDALSTIRKLKEIGVEIYFEKENIYTFGSGGEFLLTLMASLAQEESRSISENVKWGIRKSFQDGKVFLPYKNFLGYKKGENGLPEVVPEEAVIIRRIYSLFIEGKTPAYIAETLTKEGIKTPRGCSVWQQSTITSILQNEKYKGCALLQKQYTADYLTKTKKINNGEVAQYYVENSHEAIIPKEEWELVQLEFKNRKKGFVKIDNVLSSKIICGDCSSFFGPKLWHSNDKYRRTIWQCNNKFKNKCNTPHLTEDEIKSKYIEALSLLLKNKDEVINNLTQIANSLLINTYEQELNSAKKRVNDLYELCKIYMTNNDIEKIKEIVTEYNCAYDIYTAYLIEHKDKISRKASLESFINTLKETDELNLTFSNKLFIMTIDKIVVNTCYLEFCFKDGEIVKLKI